VTADHRSAARRRGAALEDAIVAAAVEELAEVGFARMTVESVARRAGAGKVSVYRRWPSKVELAVAAAYRVMGEEATAPGTGSLRGDLVALLRNAADVLAGPAGEAFRGIVSESLAGPAGPVALGALSRGHGAGQVRELLRTAALRGEDVVVDPPTRRLQAPQALLQVHFLTHGTPIDDAVIESIVDDVALPLLTGRPGSRDSPRP
jgi:AcrR family transcriptional regulator